LSTSQVYNIVEDKAGFLWIGSNKGVSRFDGSTFVNYHYYYEDGKPKKIGDVFNLVIDDKGEFLYITSRSGVLMTSLKETKFKHIKTFYPSIDFEIGNCKELYIDDDSNLWVGLVREGLLKIALNGKDHKQIQFQTIDKSKTEFESLYQINKIVPDNKNTNILWIGSSEGLIEYNKITEAYKIHYYKNNQELFQRYVKQILPIGSKLYIGTNGVNWYVFNKANNDSHQIIAENTELYHHNITGFHQDDDANLWITSFQGLVQYNTKSKVIINGESNSPKKGIIRGITLVDSRGIIWFTGEHGLYKYNPNSSTRFVEVEKKNETEFPTPISSIVQVGEYYYACPPYGLDIYKINAKDFSVSIIPVLPLRQNRSNTLRDMIKMHDDNLLVLGNKKAYILDTNTDSFTEPPIQIPNSPSHMRSVAKDKDDNYWIATNKDGLYKFNYDSLTFKKYKNLFKGKTGRDHLYIKKLFVDSQNKLWIGQASTTVMNLDDNTLICLNPEFNYQNPLPFGGFAEDNNNRIWVANTFDGISYVDQSKIDLGLNKVLEGSYSGVYKYNDSLLWTLSEGQLGLLNTNTMSHQNLNLKAKTNFTGPVVEMENGNFMIGCENGVFIYNYEKHQNNNELPKVYIQEIKGNDELLYHGNSFDKLDFTFPSGIKNLNVKISALGFMDMEDIFYKYKTDDIWIDLGTNKEISLANLRQGEYTLELKSENSLGNGLEPSVYTIRIKPYWYTSNLAYLVYVLLIGTLLFLLYKFNLNRKLALAESKKVKEIDELKSKMYANISHEFRTPLTIISGLSNELLEVNKNEEQRNLLEGITYSNKQLLNLVNQMLDLTSLDAKKMIPSYKNDDVIKFIEKCVSIYKSYSDSKLITLAFKTDEQSLYMDFDDDKLQKILNNLLSNAIKFTPEGGKVNVNLKQVNDILRIKISDTGKGIGLKNLSKIFERYYKTYDLNQNIGTGIGLALTKELVEVLQGKIHVESKKGKGTTFIVDLPIQKTSNKEEAIHKIPFIDDVDYREYELEKPNNEKATHTILLVEDNKEIRNFIKLILGDLYTIHTASNGIEGLKIAEKKQIDFIISDVMMPKMDGFEFCKHIKQDINTSHIPFVIISARTETKDKVKAYKLGVDAYLFKPFNKEELLLIIKNLLKKKQERIKYFSKLLHLQKEHREEQNISEMDLNLIKNIQEFALNKTKKMSMDEFAHSLYKSRAQLHRKVTSLTGMSITTYINHIKIEKSKTLLIETTLHINEIAFDIGFESANYFSRIFKKEQGVTPESYRSSHNK